MSRTNRRVYAGVAAGAALTLALTGCGVGGDGGADSGGSGTDGKIAGKITFQTWNLKGGYEKYFDGLIDAFEKKHPGTTVKWVDQPAEGYQDKLSADAAGGNLPDVVDMGPEAAYTLAGAGMLLNVAEDDPEAEEGYLPTAWDAMTFDGIDGGTYGYPWYLNTGPSFFNTDLFEKCGLDPEKLPETYDELFDQAAVMSENCGDEGISMIGRMPTIETFGMYGAELMNGDGTEFTFNDAKGVELVERYQALYEDSGLTEESLNALQTGELDSFKSGQLGWLPGSSYTLSDLKKTAPDVAKTVEMGPLIANTAPNMYLESLVVNSESENTATAKAFARFATDPKNQLAFAKEASVFPSTAGTLDDPYFTEDDGTDEGRLRTEAAAQVGEAVVWWPPAFSGGPDVENLREQIAGALLGKKTAKEALDDAVDYSNDRLAKQ
ncbi:sugar ABC transporter substrate-binding protein [Streptomyces synnematoformans]|uniref:Sugar ABC transporter substrate-binding protein n=1 Tax=Streptomyces synnematoformans TaxID=415721 RepID=A0ABN2Y214_9ACTN